MSADETKSADESASGQTSFHLTYAGASKLEAKAIRDQTDLQIEHIRQKGRDQIRATLTPEQTPKFEEFLKRLDEERKHKAPAPH